MSKIVKPWLKIIIAENTVKNLFSAFTQALEKSKVPSTVKFTPEQQTWQDGQIDKAEKEVKVFKPIIEHFEEHTKAYHKEIRKIRINHASVDSAGNLEKDEKGEFKYKPSKVIEMEEAIEKLEATEINWPVLVLTKEQKLDYEVLDGLIAFGADLDKPSGGSKHIPLKKVR